MSEIPFYELDFPVDDEMLDAALTLVAMRSGTKHTAPVASEAGPSTARPKAAQVQKEVCVAGPAYSNHTSYAEDLPAPPHPIPEYFDQSSLYSDPNGVPHDKWIKVSIHTARCDHCLNHNTTVIQRCGRCNRQVCKSCLYNIGPGDLHHTDPETLDWVPVPAGRRTKKKTDDLTSVSGRKKAAADKATKNPGYVGKGKGKAVLEDEDDDEVEEGDEAYGAYSDEEYSYAGF